MEDTMNVGTSALEETGITITSKPKKNLYNRIERRAPRFVKKYIFDVLNKQCYQEDLIKTYDVPNGKYIEKFGMYWFSKLSNEPICPVGNEHTLQYLVRFEIDDELVHGLGFSTAHQKWYGWSHRAIFGFGIGSTCEMGDSHFVPKNKEQMLENYLQFWLSDEESSIEDGYRNLLVETILDCKDPDNERDGLGLNIRTRTKFFGTQKKRESYVTDHWTPYPEVWGRGTWTALTLEDAMIMAGDFSDGVS